VANDLHCSDKSVTQKPSVGQHGAPYGSGRLARPHLIVLPKDIASPHLKTGVRTKEVAKAELALGTA